MVEVITIGEILADFVPEPVKTASPSTGLKTNAHRLRPGGAPSNVAINLARQGIKSAIIGKLGSDFLGDFLYEFLKKNKVDVSCVTRVKKYRTGLVFVFLGKNGERDFSFYGHPSADTFLSVSDVREDFIKKCSILHFGSISMMAEKSGKATMKAIKLAKKNKKLVSYDPNVRLNLWEGRRAQAKKTIKRYFKYADIIKISDSELKFLFNARAAKSTLDGIFGRDRLVFVSTGPKGCYVKLGRVFKHEKGLKVRAVDTTGAGDAFTAGVLSGIIKNKGKITYNNLVNLAKTANKMGAKAVMRRGAM